MRPTSHGPPGHPSTPLVACCCWLALEAGAPLTTLYAVQAKAAYTTVRHSETKRSTARRRGRSLS
jgi:hypothetical protein